jgi:hypothetical protein
MGKIRLLSLLLVATLFVQNAAATILPYSSYYQGRSYFDFDYSGISIRGRVEFAVYDTWGPYGNEWAAGTGFFDIPVGDDQYIYAYQIFNDAGSATIGRFTMEREGGGGLIIYNMGEANPDDMDPPPLEHDFVEPTNRGNDTQAWWEFYDGTLIAGEDSWFLVFSSPNKWTAGEYSMEPFGVIPVPNPEPCTVALLGLGGTILFAKRRNSIKSHRVH